MDAIKREQEDSRWKNKIVCNIGRNSNGLGCWSTHRPALKTLLNIYRSVFLHFLHLKLVISFGTLAVTVYFFPLRWFEAVGKTVADSAYYVHFFSFFF